MRPASTSVFQPASAADRPVGVLRGGSILRHCRVRRQNPSIAFCDNFPHGRSMAAGVKDRQIFVRVSLADKLLLRQAAAARRQTVTRLVVEAGLGRLLESLRSGVSPDFSAAAEDAGK